MDARNYAQYVSSDTLMGPSSPRILEALFNRHSLNCSPDDVILDLGCGTGLTSLIIARETGARVCANDLWISATENQERFDRWGVGERVTPVCGEANDLHFEKRRFSGLVSVDSFHYFAGREGFFRERLLPFLRDGSQVLIGIPGVKEAYAGRSVELLRDWLGDDACMFRSPGEWRKLIGQDDRIGLVDTWELDCFDAAWNEWLEQDNDFARGDKAHFEKLIKPYTCFVGIHIQIK